jgi:hypothetical protein
VTQSRSSVNRPLSISLHEAPDELSASGSGCPHCNEEITIRKSFLKVGILSGLAMASIAFAAYPVVDKIADKPNSEISDHELRPAEARKSCE